MMLTHEEDHVGQLSMNPREMDDPKDVKDRTPKIFDDQIFVNEKATFAVVCTNISARPMSITNIKATLTTNDVGSRGGSSEVVTFIQDTPRAPLAPGGTYERQITYTIRSSSPHTIRVNIEYGADGLSPPPIAFYKIFTPIVPFTGKSSVVVQGRPDRLICLWQIRASVVLQILRVAVDAKDAKGWKTEIIVPPAGLGPDDTFTVAATLRAPGPAAPGELAPVPVGVPSMVSLHITWARLGTAASSICSLSVNVATAAARPGHALGAALREPWAHLASTTETECGIRRLELEVVNPAPESLLVQLAPAETSEVPDMQVVGRRTAVLGSVLTMQRRRFTVDVTTSEGPDPVIGFSLMVKGNRVPIYGLKSVAHV